MRIFSLLMTLIMAVLRGLLFSSSEPARTSDTVTEANAYDYRTTISYSGPLLEPDEITEQLKRYGTHQGTFGMLVSEYEKAMQYKWVNVTPITNEPLASKVDIDLTKRYTYNELQSIQRTLARYEGVYLYRIGQSVSGKYMYALEIDLTDCAPADRHTVLLTGQVHARETAGPAYILKELIDFVKAYYAGDKETIEIAKNVRFVAVACVNPDAHDGIGFDTANWTYADGQLWKANANGADLNRNFPGLSWMMLAKGFEKTKYFSDSPKKIYYPGAHAGSEPETQAMMKFYQYFVGVEHAEMLIDYHEQGRISYAGKYYGTEKMNELATSLRKALYRTQKKGLLGKSYGYPEKTDEDTYYTYGRSGTGSTNTDYAWAVALGAKFSTQYGCSVYVDKNGAEHTILEVPQRDKTELSLEPVKVPNFRSFSWEIGYKSDYLGYSERTLKLLEKEYYNYGFDKMLYTYAAEVMQ